MPKRILTVLVTLLIAIPGASMAATIPWQFIAKQYTEALGRAPDPSGWQAYAGYFNANNCDTNTNPLSYMASQIFGSGEYTSKGYTVQEQVLTVYRAILSREPDQGGFNTWVNYLKSGNSAAQMAQQLIASAEFATIGACSTGAYRQDWAQTWPVDINNLDNNGANVWTDVQLQNCVNNFVVCNLDPGRVIRMYNTVNIPAGHTLQTSGNPDRKMYARQARIVRYSGTFGHLLIAQPGATIRNVWVSGSGNYFTPTDNNVKANIRFESNDSSTGTINSVRSDFPYQLTNIETAIANGTINITNNLTVGYASHHLKGSSTYNPWADGISQHIANGVVQNNDIVDPTDVGIVIFGHNGRTQSNSAASNIIVHAGLDAFGSMGLDTVQCTGTPSASPPNCAFSASSGTGITNNTILAGQQRRVDIVLFNGTAPWAWQNCVNNCGINGQVTNNSTIQGDALQQFQALQGTVSDAMQQGNTSNNQLNILRWDYGSCYTTPQNCINQYSH